MVLTIGHYWRAEALVVVHRAEFFAHVWRLSCMIFRRPPSDSAGT